MQILASKTQPKYDQNFQFRLPRLVHFIGQLYQACKRLKSIMNKSKNEISQKNQKLTKINSFC